MNETRLSAFDKTLQLTQAWLNEVGETVGPDAQEQYHALRSVLFALRDRLTVEEAFHLSAHLPMLVRGIYWESYRPVDKPARYRSREEFLEQVAASLDPGAAVGPEQAARAVFAVLTEHVPDGELEDVRHMLPEGVRTLFPQE